MGTTKLYAMLFAICAALAIGRTAGAAEASAHQWSRLTIYIGTSPFAGVGGYDTYGRVLARHIGQYLPGNPTVIPANKPGGGGMTLMNYMYNAAVQDGSEIAVVGRGVAMDRMLMGEKSNAKFDPEQFHWIGSMNKELSVFFAWQGAWADAGSAALISFVAALLFGGYSYCAEKMDPTVGMMPPFAFWRSDWRYD